MQDIFLVLAGKDTIAQRIEQSLDIDAKHLEAIGLEGMAGMRVHGQSLLETLVRLTKDYAAENLTPDDPTYEKMQEFLAGLPAKLLTIVVIDSADAEKILQNQPPPK